MRSHQTQPKNLKFSHFIFCGPGPNHGLVIIVSSSTHVIINSFHAMTSSVLMTSAGKILRWPSVFVRNNFILSLSGHGKVQSLKIFHSSAPPSV